MIEDTIAAIATAPGEAALAVIRISGPQAFEISQRIFRPFRNPKSEIRNLQYGRIIDSAGTTIDSGLLSRFVAPHSYTGENVVEFSGHGGPLVSSLVLETILKAGARQAEPGEFTQRAFLLGKMDLTQAEAVMDLIKARSEQAVKVAQQQLEGALGKYLGEVRESLIEVLAHIEAYIDFPDEDISPETGKALLAKLAPIETTLEALLATSERGRFLREGVRTVICGPPNVGKSSLLNYLLGFERAIVSATAGTTRDTVEEMIALRGWGLRLVDTAGLRETTETVEQEGVRRSVKQLERADLVLEVADASLPPTNREPLPVKVESERHLLILNKTDLGIHPGWKGEGSIQISCANQIGMKTLEDEIEKRLLGGNNSAMSLQTAINTRHRNCLERALDALVIVRQGLGMGLASELIALDVRTSLDAVGEVMGKVDVEDILDKLFSNFCIGK